MVTFSSNTDHDDDVVRMSSEAWQAFRLALDRPPARVGGLADLLERESAFEPPTDLRPMTAQVDFF